MNIDDIKKKLYDIDCEIESRKKSSKLEKYNAGKKKYKKQILFHKSLKKNRWVFGGNRSGKTECGAVETIWIARGCHPYRENKPDTVGWVVSLSTQVQRDVAQSKILGYLDKSWIVDIVMINGRKDAPELGVIDTIIIKNVFGGYSKIGFKSCDQGREKFQGASLDYVWFDEEPPYDIYKECLMRVIDRHGIIYGTMTPLKGLTWVYNDIYLNANKKNLILSASDMKNTVKKDYEKLKESAEADAIKRGLARSSIVINTLDAFNKDELETYKAIDKELTDGLNAINFELNALVSAKDDALRDFDIEYASELTNKINETTEKLKEAQEKVIKYNNDIAEKEANYLKSISELEKEINESNWDRDKDVAELIAEYGITVVDRG